MNDTIKIILNRRSIRKYKNEQIKEDELQTILEAGKYAPCGLNQQSTYFTVVQNNEMLKKINDVCKEVYLKSGIKTFEERAKADNFCMYYNAPTFVIACGEKEAAAHLNNGSVALENMLIAAESMHIGSCWIHALTMIFQTDEGQALKKELGIPDNHIFVGAAVFGYKDMPQPSPAPRKEGTVKIIR
jgi:nitroreductase